MDPGEAGPVVDLEMTAGNSGSTAVSRPGVVGICSKAGLQLVFMSCPADLWQGRHRKTPPPLSRSHEHQSFFRPLASQAQGWSQEARERNPSPTPSGESEAGPVVPSGRWGEGVT